MKKNKRLVIGIVHVALWICFMALPFIFFPDFKELPERISNRILVNHAYISILLITFYYFNTQFLIPKLLFRTKWWLYGVITISCFVTFLYLPSALTDLTLGPREKEPHFSFADNKKPTDSLQPATTAPVQANRPPQLRRNNNWRNNPFRFYPGSYAVFLLIYTIGTCIAVMQRWLSTERTKQEIENEKLNTELSFLKSQVNPHFFFNTLNNIYSLAVVGSDQTATAVLKLSAIMRYILTETQIDKVPLQNEIDFITNFIDLQLVRLTDKVHINFTSEGETGQSMVAPLLFIPFVENAFKYGVSTKEKTEIVIRFITKENHIQLYVSNTIVKADNGIHDTTGIGINNVKRRLELLYPGQEHTLLVKEENNLFIVKLDIFIK